MTSAINGDMHVGGEVFGGEAVTSAEHAFGISSQFTDLTPRITLLVYQAGPLCESKRLLPNALKSTACTCIDPHHQPESGFQGAVCVEMYRRCRPFATYLSIDIRSHHSDQ